MGGGKGVTLKTCHHASRNTELMADMQGSHHKIWEFLLKCFKKKKAPADLQRPYFSYAVRRHVIWGIPKPLGFWLQADFTASDSNPGSKEI